MTRLALVGVGRWGRNLLRVLAPRSDVVACVGRSSISFAPWLAANHPDVRATTDLSEVLDDPTIDAIVIATPIATHAELATQALAKGKHVFVEKPLAASPAEAQALVTKARDASLTLFVGHTFLYDEALRHLRDRLGGAPAAAWMTWTKYGSFSEGLLENLVSHDVAIAHWLFAASPLEVAVHYSRGVRTAADIACYELAFPAGRCLVTVDRCAASTRKAVTVQDERGGLLLWENGRVLLGGDRGPEVVFERRSEPLDVEVEAFLRAVRTGAPALTDGTFGAEVVATLGRLSAAASHG